MAQREQHRLDHFASDSFECPSTQPSKHTPRLRLQQPLPELSVRSEEQPVLRKHEAGGSSLCAQMEAALQKRRGQVILGAGVIPLTEHAQCLALLAARKVGHVGDDECVPVGKQLRGPRHPTCGHCPLNLVVARALLFQHDSKQFSNGLEIALEEICFERARVNERTEHRRLFKEPVQSFHAALKRRGEQCVIDTEQVTVRGKPTGSRGLLRQRRPLLPGRIGRQAGTGKVHLREKPIAFRARVRPGCECEGERRNFDATRVQLQAMQVFPQYRVHRVTGREALQLHAHRNQHREGGDEKVPRAAAGVQQAEPGEVVGPAGKSAAGGCPCEPFFLCPSTSPFPGGSVTSLLVLPDPRSVESRQCRQGDRPGPAPVLPGQLPLPLREAPLPPGEGFGVRGLKTPCRRALRPTVIPARNPFAEGHRDSRTERRELPAPSGIGCACHHETSFLHRCAVHRRARPQALHS